MQNSSAPRPGAPSRLRILAPFLGGLSFLLLLAFAAWYRFKHTQNGLTAFIAEGFQHRPIREFGTSYGLKILLPSYLVSGLTLWMLTLGWGFLWKRDWRHGWRFREAFGFTLSALGWVHLVLWWQVPSTLWVVPGLRALPYFLVFPLLVVLCLAYPIRWTMASGLGAAKKGGLLAGWLLLWSSPVALPQVAPRLLVRPKGGQDPCRMLLLGIDGLRSDEFLAHTDGWQGVRYRNAYTPIPATRLLWHILWGGEPLYYTVGHAPPSVEEYKNLDVLPILREANARGWKPRFYIDDGGTISLAGRDVGFDDVLMPARGWENFVNSNLAASFPLYANYENWGKPFPTTNPWAPLDAGLKEALRLGRGSKWVMFHSCLAHQPIFLSRGELGQLGRWWTLAPYQLEPMTAARLVTPAVLSRSDARTNPFRAYEIRMESILRAWEPIWNGLDQDPDYRLADRVLFSDHGERFYHVTESFQLQGVHGYDLDPWETHAAFLAAGPRFPKGHGLPAKDETVSLLCLRDGARRWIEKDRPMDEKFIEGRYPKAPLRYHTLDTSVFTGQPSRYLCLDEKDLAAQCYIGPDGIWYTVYTKSAKDRAAEVSLGLAEGAISRIYKPLPAGGADEYTFDRYELKAIRQIQAGEFERIKHEIEEILEPGASTGR